MENPAEKTESQTAAEEKLFNFRPVLFAAIFLALGVVFGYLHSLCGVSAWWALGLLPAAVTPFLFCRSFARAKKTLVAEIALGLCFLVGGGAFCGQIQSFTDCGSYDGEYPVLGRVVDYEETKYGLCVTLDRLTIGKNGENGKLVAYLPASFAGNVRLSDELLLRGQVRTQTDIISDYGLNAYAIGDDIRFSMQAESGIVTGRAFDPCLYIRERMREVVYAGMDETSAAVTMAVLTGDTSGIGEGLLENVRRGGIAHIFAVSGLHIGALYALCLVIMQKTPLQRIPKLARFLLTGGILLFYGGVCGFSASVVRALVMCLILYASSLNGISSDPLERIGAAAIVVLLLSPVSLFETGFQLSFVACLGIVMLGRRISHVIDRGCKGVAGLFVGKSAREREEQADPNADGHPLTVPQRVYRACISFLGVTLSAQIATAPVCLYAFGYFSGWALFLNCLFVPLIGAAFSVLLGFVFLACLLPTSVSFVVLYVPYVFWSATLLLFQTADFSGFAIENVRLAFFAFVQYYLGLTFASDKWNVSGKIKCALFLICMTAFVGTVYALNI